LDLVLGESGPILGPPAEDVEHLVDLSEAEADVLAEPDERHAFDS
jgi:hypothetical protein